MLKEVFDLEDGQVVGCYFCMKCGSHADYKKGEAFLAGPDHSPYDGNANYICIDHLDDEVALPEEYPADYLEQKRSCTFETVVKKVNPHG